ncbi:MAG: carbon-nitrogen hydrolase family protein [Chitinophagaceae bacterium]|nr:carbon-nitrogen hydrolase family protein [Chitinophagaceae bacterium]
MRIAVAQTRPVKGDVQKNIAAHSALIELAVDAGADCIFFPELSVTGYEPELAKTLAIQPEDQQLGKFQHLSDANNISIGVGMPLRQGEGICISSIIFQSNKPRLVYSKRYLHSDEEPFFVSGKNGTAVFETQPKTALAICYELSIPQHQADAVDAGAGVYLVSAVKDVKGIEKSLATLSDIASRHSMIVLLSNCIGTSGGYDCAGRSSIWNRKGELIGQLDANNEGILMIDTENGDIVSSQ